MLTVRTRVIVAVGSAAPMGVLATWSEYGSHYGVWLRTLIEESESALLVNLPGSTKDTGTIIGLHARLDSVERILSFPRLAQSSSDCGEVTYSSQDSSYTGNRCREPNRIVLQHLRWRERSRCDGGLDEIIARRLRVVVFSRRWARHCEVRRVMYVVQRVRYCAGRSKTVTLKARVLNAVASGRYEIDFMSSPVGLSEGIG